MSPDRFGVVIEDGLTLRHPRIADDSAPTFDEAVRLAVEVVRGGEERVTVSLVRYDEAEEVLLEVKSLLTVQAHPYLHDLDDEEES